MKLPSCLLVPLGLLFTATALAEGNTVRVRFTIAAATTTLQAEAQSFLLRKMREIRDVEIVKDQPTLSVLITVTELRTSGRLSGYVGAFVVQEPYTKEYLTVCSGLADATATPVHPGQPIIVPPGFQGLPNLYAGERPPLIVVEGNLEALCSKCAALIDARHLERVRQNRN